MKEKYINYSKGKRILDPIAEKIRDYEEEEREQEN